MKKKCYSYRSFIQLRSFKCSAKTSFLNLNFNIKNTLKKLSSKKAQAWSIDVAVAVVIFIAALIILYFYAVNYSDQSKQQLGDLFYQGNTAAELILAEDDLGILSDGKVNQEKLETFYYSDYESMKIVLGVRDDFYFILPEMEIEGNPVSYIGNMNSGPVSNSIKIDRFTVYKNKLVKFQLFVWSD